MTETKALVHVEMENGTAINTTENHPFYVEGKGWVAAAELEAGDILHTQGGREETVAGVTVDRQEEPVKVYNLTIEDYHTYYVSEESVLVHNDGCVQKNNDGTYEITDWSDYPDELIHPEGPFNILTGDDYTTARKDASSTNANLHRIYNYLKGLHIHEVLPVKFGGSPTDIDNKVALTPKQHSQFTVFWNRVLKEIKEMAND